MVYFSLTNSVFAELLLHHLNRIALQELAKKLTDIHQ
jgi:hypothetical protein